MLREEAKHSRGRGCPGTASLGGSPTLGPQDQTGEAGVGASRRRQWAEAGGHCGAAGARTGDAGVREGLGRCGQPACQARASDGLSVGAVASGGVTGLLSARTWVPPLLSSGPLTSDSKCLICLLRRPGGRADRRLFPRPAKEMAPFPQRAPTATELLRVPSAPGTSRTFSSRPSDPPPPTTEERLSDPRAFDLGHLGHFAALLGFQSVVSLSAHDLFHRFRFPFFPLLPSSGFSHSCDSPAPEVLGITYVLCISLGTSAGFVTAALCPGSRSTGGGPVPFSPSSRAAAVPSLSSETSLLLISERSSPSISPVAPFHPGTNRCLPSSVFSLPLLEKPAGWRCGGQGSGTPIPGALSPQPAAFGARHRGPLGHSPSHRHTAISRQKKGKRGVPIGKEEAQAFLSADDIILYVENPKNPLKNLCDHKRM